MGPYRLQGRQHAARVGQKTKDGSRRGRGSAVNNDNKDNNNEENNNEDNDSKDNNNEDNEKTKTSGRWSKGKRWVLPTNKDNDKKDNDKKDNNNEDNVKTKT